MNDQILGFIAGLPYHLNSATASVGAPVQTVGTGLSDLTSGGTSTAVVDHVYTIKITTASTTDAFELSTDGGTFGSSTNVTGSAQTLANGVTVTFAATTGHTLGNTWTITVAAGKVIQSTKSTLHRIIVNTVGSGITLAIYNGTSSGGVLIASLTGTLTQGPFEYALECVSGLYVILYASTTYPDTVISYN